MRIILTTLLSLQQVYTNVNNIKLRCSITTVNLNTYTHRERKK